MYVNGRASLNDALEFWVIFHVSRYRSKIYIVNYRSLRSLLMTGDSAGMLFRLRKLRFNNSYCKYLEYALKIFWLYRRVPSRCI